PSASRITSCELGRNGGLSFAACGKVCPPPSRPPMIKRHELTLHHSHPMTTSAMTPPTTAPAIPLKEFDAEMASTRRLLERIPSDKATWKPHEKSFALGHLAQLVAGMPGWITLTLREPELDLSKQRGYSFEKTETLLAVFDENVASARQALIDVTGP